MSPDPRAMARAAVAAGLGAADAEARTREAVASVRLPLPDPGGRLVVLGWGKAALPMLRGALDALCARGLRPDAGLVVVKDGQAGGAARLGPVELREASHPVPDERSAAAGRDLLALASTLRDGDALLALSSGGGTSLLAAPLPPATPASLRRTWTRLLRDGTDVASANAIRRELSAVAAGRLARAAGRARSLTLVVSDVPGDDPRVVASGPMADGASPHAVVASSDDAVRAAAASLAETGCSVALQGPLTGDAAQAGRRIAAELRRAAERAAPGEVVAIVEGGETTVRVRGEAPGGRNVHLAASAAAALAGRPLDWALASVATDGEDGSSGSAGGLVGPGSARRWSDAGLDADEALARCDALRLLRASGDLVPPWTARTNVADLLVAVARRT